MRIVLKPSSCWRHRTFANSIVSCVPPPQSPEKKESPFSKPNQLYPVEGVCLMWFGGLLWFAWEQSGRHVAQAPMETARMTAPPREGLFYRGKWLWMWPNWTLSLFEGGMNTSRINPIGTKRTEQLYHFYFADLAPELDDKRSDTIARNLAVVREDFEICAKTHNNYESGNYSAGPLSPRHEQGVRYFQDKVKESLGV